MRIAYFSTFEVHAHKAKATKNRPWRNLQKSLKDNFFMNNR